MENEKSRSNTINLRTDFTDSNMSVEIFHNWNPQNFTELLNKPKVSSKN